MEESSMPELFDLLRQFALEGTAVSCEPYGIGHIHDTYLVEADSGEKYILQRINHRIFLDVPALMRNIDAVTRHLSKGEKDPRRVLTLIHTKNGGLFFFDEKADAYYRVYRYVTDSLCLNRAETPLDLYQCGVAFGRFQRQLADFPASTLTETIKRFHDTKKRFSDFHKAVAENPLGYAGRVSREIVFALAREKEAAQMVDMHRKNELPTRVTHNDTKLNNVMLDADTRQTLCVIDLDTVMPGLAGNDFGDAIRFGASTAEEDEADLSKVSLSIPLFEAFTKGFLGACGRSLTENEIRTLTLGAKLMTLECGIRFLGDYLLGNVYFHVSKPEHNLIRCRAQFALIADMEQKWPQLETIVETEWKRLKHM